MERKEQGQVYLEKLKEALEDIEGKMDAEQQRTDQDWLACFNTRLTPIMGFLELAIGQGAMDKDKGYFLVGLLQALTQEVKQLQQAKRKDPSHAIDQAKKQDFLQRININKVETDKAKLIVEFNGKNFIIKADRYPTSPAINELIQILDPDD